MLSLEVTTKSPITSKVLRVLLLLWCAYLFICIGLYLIANMIGWLLLLSVFTVWVSIDSLRTGQIGVAGGNIDAGIQRNIFWIGVVLQIGMAITALVLAAQ